MFRLFFSDNRTDLQEWKEKNEDSRDFYSNEVRQWGIRYFTNCLIKINESLDIWVRKTISEKKIDLNFEEYEQLYEKKERLIEKIRENLLRMMVENRVSDLAERFLFICREIYTDIACILTLQLQPDNYQNAFDKSKQLRSDEKYIDSVRTIRNYVVSFSAANHVPAQEKKLWMEYANNLLSDFPRNSNNLKKQTLLAFSQTYVILSITPQMKKMLMGYAHECAKDFSAKLDSIEEIKSFREYMSRVRNKDVQKKQELLTDIMMGDFDKIFLG